ncbi:DNA-formamidopyrimidine glycosylase [candidate division KSB1 bacterium]|nr:DNA-formamidopyrimidine glycosylase [candidate division KSB1 bacterium]
MPELPDLVYIQKHLADFLPGKRIKAVEIKEPIVLRALIPEGFEDGLKNACFQKVYRHGPFLTFTFESDVELVIHPMLAGKFKIAESADKPGRSMCFSLHLDDGSYFNYLDDKKMGKVYLTQSADFDKIPRYLQQGINILSKEFTLEKFQNLIAKQRKQVRVFLMDQTRLSAIGNAYADEILFDAGLHPKTFCNQLTAAEVDTLYDSILRVIKWGIEQVEKAAKPIEIKVRDHVKVRNRKDQPCPKCNTTIRRAGVLGHDTFFCPDCQPAKRAQFITWN